MSSKTMSLEMESGFEAIILVLDVDVGSPFDFSRTWIYLLLFYFRQVECCVWMVTMMFASNNSTLRYLIFKEGNFFD